VDEILSSLNLEPGIVSTLINIVKVRFRSLCEC